MSSTSNSKDFIVKARDVNTVNIEIVNMSNDKGKKHQEYLLNTGCKSTSSGNTKNNENSLQARKENTTEKAETNKVFHWPSGTCAILWLMASTKRNYKNMAILKFFTFQEQELMI